ncbi:hypothetical protein AB6Q56_00790 [Dechloromonas sp. ARDL1]|uniref:hypothetical protein n=1 Tax=Dechloromonas sp. ARDL1 TaxID=3322121 RepID=UPI003DA75641
MRRGIVISLVVHVLVLLGLSELRLLPAYTHSADKGRSVITVELAVLKALESAVSDRPGNAPRIAPEAHSERRIFSTTASRQRPSGMRLQASHRVEPLTSPELQSVPGLPAEVEGAYRLNIARELRKAGKLSHEGGTFAQGASVRLVISYRAGLYAPVVSVERSSGHANLDEMAVASLREAVTRVQLPDADGFRMLFVMEFRQAP